MRRSLNWEVETKLGWRTLGSGALLACIMNANRQQLQELFHAAVELSRREREAFLKANCSRDDELNREVFPL